MLTTLSNLKDVFLDFVVLLHVTYHFNSVLIVLSLFCFCSVFFFFHVNFHRFSQAFFEFTLFEKSCQSCSKLICEKIGWLFTDHYFSKLYLGVKLFDMI